MTAPPNLPLFFDPPGVPRESWPEEPKPVVFHETGECVMASHKNLTVVAWGCAATLALTRELNAFAGDFDKAHPEGHSSIHLITSDASLPTSDARAELERITDRFALNLACVGVVLDGDGFWAGAMRGFLTSLHWASRRPFEARYCSTLGELGRWLPRPHAARTKTFLSGAEVTSVLFNLRGRLVRKRLQAAQP